VSDAPDVPIAPDADPELFRGRERLMVDFDGTITRGDAEYWAGERPEPDPDTIELVNAHYNAGGVVVVWTARQWSEAGRVAGHLTEWGVKFHGIRCGKGSADAYLDDRAVRHGGGE